MHFFTTYARNLFVIDWCVIMCLCMYQMLSTPYVLLECTQSPQKPIIKQQAWSWGRGGELSQFLHWISGVPLLKPLPRYYRPYPRHFWANVTLNPIVTIENATPFQSIQTWKCNPIRRQIPNSLLLGSKRHSKYTEDNNKYLWAI